MVAGNLPEKELINLIHTQIPALVVVYNIKTGVYTYVNDGITTLLGYTPKDFLEGGITFASSLVHPDDLSRIREQNRKALEKANKSETTTVIETFEYRMRHKNGSWRWLHSDGTVFERDAKGKVLQVMNVSVDITQRKEAEFLAEKKALEGEQRYQAFVRQSNEGIWRFELKKPVAISLSPAKQVAHFFKYAFLAECNDATARMYGYRKREDIEGNMLSAFMVADDPANIDYLKAFIKSGYRLSQVQSHEKDKEGNDKYFENSLVGVIEDGMLIRAWGTQRDITEEKRVKQSLQIRLAQETVVTELGVSALSGKSLKALFQEATERVKEVLRGDYISILEYIPAEKVMVLRAGKGWKKEVGVDKTIVPAGKHSHAGYTLGAKRPVIIQDIAKEKRFSISPPLSTHPATSGVSCIIYGKDTPYGVLGVHTKDYREFTRDDVIFLQSVANLLALTIERKRIEDVLVLGEERLRLALDAGKIGVWDWDMRQNILTWSDKVYELYGVKKEKYPVTFEGFNKLIHTEDRERVKKAIEESLAGKAAYEIEFRIIRDNDKTVRWMYTRGMVFTKKDTAIRMLGATIDITKLRELEKQKDEFLGIASHELKTPVTSLKAYTQVLQNRFAKIKHVESATLLAKMDNQLNKLTSLIADLLDVTKIEKGRIQFSESYFDFNELVEEIREEMQRTTEKHRLTTAFGRSKTVKADRDRIGQVVTNLLANAIKYSPQGENIIIKTWADKDMISVSVQDFGIGIAADKKEKVFERFFREDDPKKVSFPGLGLGLYISSEIIRRHDGNIWVESQKGKGSVFSFSIPIEKQL